jgi:hypothetical protein
MTFPLQTLTPAGACARWYLAVVLCPSWCIVMRLYAIAYVRPDWRIISLLEGSVAGVTQNRPPIKAAAPDTEC